MVILALSMATNAWPGSDGPTPFRLVREVVLENGALPDPLAIERLTDGGFVIVGRMPKDKAAWATKVDANGSVQWRYLVTSVNPEPGGSYPEFTGVAATPDGGALLCGRMDIGQPRKPTINGLLVRFDKIGRLVNKQFIAPPPGSEVSHVAFLDRCVAWPGGFALTGRVTRYSAGGRRDDFHWIVAVDSEGTIQWQRLISKQSVGSGAPGQVRTMPDGSLIIAVIQGADTEVLRVDTRGELRARSAVPGHLRLVQSLTPHADPELFDCYGGPSRGRFVQLTADLHISAETVLPFSPEYTCGPAQYAMQLYSLADGSLVLFGHRYTHGSNVAAAVKWDATFSSDRPQLFPTPPSWWFYAAMPSGKLGDFATVRVTGIPTTAGGARERAMYVSFFDVN